MSELDYWTGQPTRFMLACYFLTIIFMVAFVGWKLEGAIEDSKTPVMCQEDEVIVGVGDYHDNTWQGYRCENREEVN